jgi:hypothetical protein
VPQIDFAPEHKKATEQDIDRLKLKNAERARIVCLEKPTYAWVHTLRAPKIINGKAVMISKERKSGDSYQDFDLDFIGRPLCLGDYGIITDKGVDATNCPACAASRNSDEVGPPERRFAMNVVRYGLARDGALVSPFACTCVVWGFTEGLYNKLVDIATEHGSIIGRDLVLGPCTNEGFQKYEIMPAGKNAWQLDDNIKRIVQETFTANRLEDLERACGRKVDRRFVEQDLDNISNRWRLARGDTSPPDGTEAVDHAALTAGLNDLLGTTPTPASTPPTETGTGEMVFDLKPAAPATAQQVDVSDLFPGSDTAPAQPAPATDTAVDFAALLGQL